MQLSTLKQKWFKIQAEGFLKVLTTAVEVSNIDSAFNKMCSQLKMGEGSASLMYPQRNDSGTFDTITVNEDDEYRNEGMMTWFLTCEEGQKVIMRPGISVSSKKAGRDLRFTEYGYNTIVGHCFTVQKDTTSTSEITLTC